MITSNLLMISFGQDDQDSWSQVINEEFNQPLNQTEGLRANK